MSIPSPSCTGSCTTREVEGQRRSAARLPGVALSRCMTTLGHDRVAEKMDDENPGHLASRPWTRSSLTQSPSVARHTPEDRCQEHRAGEVEAALPVAREAARGAVRARVRGPA